VCAKPATEGVEASANNGDIAVAIDALTQIHQVDLINISLAGQEPSEIEADAIQAAIEAGVLVICSAGNESGSPVMYPAAAPGAVAVSAVGLTHAFPAASLDQLTVPQDTTRFAPGGLYAANFNSVGTQIACSGPGVAVISTVPGSTATEPAYAAMSGTSMASPAVCGALATLLSEDSQYQKMPRDQARAYYAWAVLSQSLRWLGLDPQLAGLGLVRAAS
jgi:subtilisin family serine protease